MAMTVIPGAAKHAIITDDCRRAKGDDAVIEEALQRLRDEWPHVAKGWPVGAGGRFHVVLIVERPGPAIAGLTGLVQVPPEALAEYEQAMKEAIPQISDDIRRRERLADEARRRLLGPAVDDISGNVAGTRA